MIARSRQEVARRRQTLLRGGLARYSQVMSRLRATSLTILSSFIGVVACGGGDEKREPVPARPVATAVGSPSGAATSATIGAAGGSVASGDGRLLLTVPAGALGADTVVTVTPITNTAHGGVGSAYRLTPDGLTFAQPVTLAFALSAAERGGSDPRAFGAAFQTGDGYWQWLGTPAIDGDHVQVTTTHFTDFSAVRGTQIFPRSADVRVNETAALRVVDCYPAQVGEDDLAPLGYDCATDDEDAPISLAIISDWAVNGVAGGSSEVGTVTSREGRDATYKAPASKPASNPVAVSARTSFGGGGGGKILIVSNLNVIDDAPSYAGSVSWESPVNNFTGGSASVTFTIAQRYNSTDAYIGRGTISATLTLPDCAPAQVSSALRAAEDLDDWHLESYLEVRNAQDDHPNTFEFMLIGEPTMTAVTCGESSGQYTLEYEVSLLTLATFCPPAGYPAYSDPAVLTGAYACAGSNQDASFTFTRQ